MAKEPDETRKNHGGRRAGSGRKKGVVSETKQTLAENAREYGTRMLGVLASIADDPEQPASARVSAANHVLERGYGKAASPQDAPPVDRLAQAIKEINERGSAAPIATARRIQQRDDDE